MEQRALARAAGPDDRDELAPAHLEIDPGEHLDRVAVAPLVHLPEALRLEDRAHSCRIASTGVRLAAAREGYTVASTAMARLAPTTTRTSRSSTWTGR